MTWLVRFCALIVCISLAVQTRRVWHLERASAATVSVLDQLRTDAAAYKLQTVRNLQDTLDSLALHGDTYAVRSDRVLIAAIDVRCAACGRALVTLRDRGNTTVHVVSAYDSDRDVLEWLSSLEVDATLLPTEMAARLLPHIPNTVTPVFLELESGQVLDVWIGQPKDSWLRHAAGRALGSR